MKRIVACFLFSIMLLGVISPICPVASAAVYNPRLSLPENARTTIKEYMVDSSPGWGNYNPYSAFNIGNCTWYAFGRAWEILGYFPNDLIFAGDAGVWFDKNKEKYDSGNGGFLYSTNRHAPALGAIAVWQDTSKPYGEGGHVAVVEQISDNGNGTKTIVTSESAYASYYFRTITRSTEGTGLGWSGKWLFLGYIYINGTEGFEPGPPTIATISTDHTSYEVDETVTFSMNTNGITNTLWIYCPNGDTLYYQDVGATYQLAFGMSGHFQALVEAWNGEGSLCSDRIDFYVGSPTYAYLSTNKTHYAVDERVYFTIDADGIQNNLWIYCPDGETLTYLDVGNSYDLGFGMSGHFQALVETWNGVGSKCSERIDFYVGNQTVTVTFDPNGGSVSPTSMMVTIGSAYGNLPSPTRTYYNFDGWYTAASGGNLVTASTTVTATTNHTLYAHWTHVCAGGHNYSFSVETAPTTAAEGTLVGTCSRCGETTSIVLPVLTTEDYDYAVVQEPTCTADGIGCYTWKNTAYGTFSFDVIIPKTGITNPFTDIEEGNYYYEPVLWAYYHDPQITSGTSETTFGPKALCTRAEVVTFLWRAAGSPEPQTTASSFTDIQPGKYYYEAVLWAVENDITAGISETTFGPNNSCTRSQAVTFLWRFAGSPEPESSESPFTDVKPEAYYSNAVLWAFENGVTSGTSDNTFSPETRCTRGQIITFLYRYMNQ